MKHLQVKWKPETGENKRSLEEEFLLLQRARMRSIYAYENLLRFLTRKKCRFNRFHCWRVSGSLQIERLKVGNQLSSHDWNKFFQNRHIFDQLGYVFKLQGHLQSFTLFIHKIQIRLIRFMLNFQLVVRYGE